MTKDNLNPSSNNEVSESTGLAPNNSTTAPVPDSTSSVSKGTLEKSPVKFSLFGKIVTWIIYIAVCCLFAYLFNEWLDKKIKTHAQVTEIKTEIKETPKITNTIAKPKPIIQETKAVTEAPKPKPQIVVEKTEQPKYFQTCQFPLKYSLGNLDTRFGLQENEALSAMRNAERTWEDVVQINMFEYDPTSVFKINFVFDERSQQETDTKLYKQQLATHNNSIVAYNKRNAAWNANPRDASDPEYKYLTSELKRLDETTEQLNTEFNRLAKRATELEVKYPDPGGSKGYPVAEMYYKLPGKIEVYAYSNFDNLTGIIAHELGHASGMNHTTQGKDNIMSPAESIDAIHKPSHLDLEEFLRVCPPTRN